MSCILVSFLKFQQVYKKYVKTAPVILKYRLEPGLLPTAPVSCRASPTNQCVLRLACSEVGLSLIS